MDGDETAELKRIWTDRRHRRRGYGRILLEELESRIARLGYRRYTSPPVTASPRPRHSNSAGYARLTEPRPGGEVYAMAFEKLLF